MKTSVSSYSFSQYIRAGKMTQSDCVGKARELGFNAVEFTDIAGENYDKQLKNAIDIRERADKTGIEINAYTIGASLYNETEDENRAEIERLKKTA